MDELPAASITHVDAELNGHEDDEETLDVDVNHEGEVDAEDAQMEQARATEVDNDDENAEDTTAAQAAAGKDIQGIPWEGLLFTRERYRETRLRQYKNYENLNASHEQIKSEIVSPCRDGDFYSFRYNSRAVRSNIVHFQLRNLVWATTKHDVYLMYQHGIFHYSPLSRRSQRVLNLAGGQYGIGRVQISTMTVQDQLLAAGGFNGEMVCKNLANDQVIYNSRISHDDNAITNAIHIQNPPSGGLRVITSNNDCMVRVFDLQSFTPLNRFYFPWAVNHATTSPDSKLLCVVGDDTTGFLADAQTGKAVAHLKGHIDYSFASAWHPDGRVVATGNQDTTCRLWDVRYPGNSLCVLGGHIGAIRSLRFSSDGKYLALSEPADFIHIYDCASSFTLCQEIDLFGEIAGLSFTPNGEGLFIGIADRTYGSLVEFERKDRGLLSNSII